MLYSVRMRAAEGGAHEAGGRHISGAERLVSKEGLTLITEEMMVRALEHARGQADFINLTVEVVPAADIVYVPLLPVRTVPAPGVAAGREAALEVLAKNGISRIAAEKGMALITGLADSMRGAMLVCAVTGERLDHTGNRGVRVSRMDIDDASVFKEQLTRLGLANIHVQEALVLASKVASTPGVLAELCWSDDPEYTAGYVASSKEYCRFPNLKPLGSPVGGRVFFVQPESDLDAIIHYLRQKPVLVKAGG